MRVHLLAVPNVQTTSAYFLDGFCTRTILFARLLKRLGHEVILYASEENEAPCEQFIGCITKAEQQQMLGEVPYQAASFEAGTPLAITFNTRVANHIRSIKQPGDIICSIAGSGQAQVAEAHPELLFCEYSVGYAGVAPMSHRVYESATWQGTVYGFMGVRGGRLFDAVIPPWFLAEEFPFVARPEPYVIYCGRITLVKGVQTVCDAAEKAGVKLIVIGHGQPELVTYGEFLGAVPNEERNRLIANASACLMPTQYVEPFGNVAAEAQLCGTPMITTDFGAFHESVEHGRTGYRCGSLGEFVQAIRLAPKLDRSYIRARAIRLYSEESALESYARYFARLQTIHGAGWSSLVPTLKESYGSESVDPGADEPVTATPRAADERAQLECATAAA